MVYTWTGDSATAHCRQRLVFSDRLLDDGRRRRIFRYGIFPIDDIKRTSLLFTLKALVLVRLLSEICQTHIPREEATKGRENTLCWKTLRTEAVCRVKVFELGIGGR